MSTCRQFRSSFRSFSPPSRAETPPPSATLEPAWARIRTPSPEIISTQSIIAAEHRRRQFRASFRSSSPQSRAETQPPSASPEPAWARIRTPSPEIVYFSRRGASTLPFPQPSQPVLNQMPCTSPTSDATSTISPIFTPQSNFYGQKTFPPGCWQKEQPRGKMAPTPLQIPTANCTEQWSTEEEVLTPRLRPMAGTIVTQGSMAGTIVTQGSMGHPYNCAPACKYATKKRGCKDGAACSHCHLCVWHNNRDSKHALQGKFCSRAYMPGCQ